MPRPSIDTDSPMLAATPSPSGPCRGRRASSDTSRALRSTAWMGLSTLGVSTANSPAPMRPTVSIVRSAPTSCEETRRSRASASAWPCCSSSSANRSRSTAQHGGAPAPARVVRERPVDAVDQHRAVRQPVSPRPATRGESGGGVHTGGGPSPRSGSPWGLTKCLGSSHREASGLSWGDGDPSNAPKRGVSRDCFGGPGGPRRPTVPEPFGRAIGITRPMRSGFDSAHAREASSASPAIDPPTRCTECDRSVVIAWRTALPGGRHDA